MTKQNQPEQPSSVTMTDRKVEFEEWAKKDGTYDLRPAKVHMLSIGGEKYDGYQRPYLQDRTVQTYQGFVAGFNAALLSDSSSQDAIRNAALEICNHCGYAQKAEGIFRCACNDKGESK